MSSVDLGEGATQGMLSVWDMPGGAAYMPMCQPYMVDGSMYALVVPALDLPVLKTMYHEYVGRWLDALRVGAELLVHVVGILVALLEMVKVVDEVGAESQQFGAAYRECGDPERAVEGVQHASSAWGGRGAGFISG